MKYGVRSTMHTSGSSRIPAADPFVATQLVGLASVIFCAFRRSYYSVHTGKKRVHMYGARRNERPRELGGVRNIAWRIRFALVLGIYVHGSMYAACMYSTVRSTNPTRDRRAGVQRTGVLPCICTCMCVVDGRLGHQGVLLGYVLYGVQSTEQRCRSVS